MTEIVYQSESISNIIAVFAIECSIIFGFILLVLVCCVGKCFGSNTENDQNNFVFEKYSSQHKLNKKFINELFQKKINSTDNNTKNSICGNMGWFKSCCTNTTNTNTNTTNTNTNTNTNTTNTNTNTNTNTDDLEIDLEIGNEIKENISFDNLDESKSKSKITFNENNKINIEKIYIIYEFNNLDKTINPSTYIDSNSSDEFDELEEFVNMTIKSFKDKYKQIGIILKISSPGGSAFKFEHAYLNLMRLRDKKIEIIGIVDKMAASGGYMLAMACDKIICSKYAIIGSVGVIAQLYNWADFGKKLGLEEKTFTTGSHKNPFPMGSPYSEEDVERMNEMIQDTFVVFKDIVLCSRKFTPEQIEQIIKAKTFHGFQALDLGMVDEISMGNEYIDQLDEKSNIWICAKDKKSKSFLNSLLGSNVRYLTNSIQNSFNKILLDKQVDNIKLL